jgi:6-pyruvoyltetrahydropterin/6-carboxytetrahydropterin synthase
VFEASDLDERNWVVDFGSLKSFKGWLEDTFDHKLLIAEDDPKRSLLATMDFEGCADIRVLPALGMEQFARMIYEYLEGWLIDNGYSPRVTLAEVEVKEHGANSAFVRRR